MIEKSLPKGKASGNKKRPWIGLQERVIGCIGKAGEQQFSCPGLLVNQSRSFPCDGWRRRCR